jgi:hypothetical protein
MLTSKHLRQIKLITVGALSEFEAAIMESKTSGKERVFSVELKSKRNLKNVTLTNGSSNSVLVEGTIGKLVQATFAEGVILEVVGKKGVLRIDLGEDEIKKTTEQNPTKVKKNDGTEQDENCRFSHWRFCWAWRRISRTR